MERFETEEQQVEALKGFWKQYGLSIVGGAVLGLGGLWGWNSYQANQLHTQELASAAYEKVLNAADQQQSFDAAVAEFNESYSNSAYGALIALLQAYESVDMGELEQAAVALNSAVAQLDNSIKPLAQLRLARVQLALDQLDVALATVNGITNAAYQAQQQELKGDILFAQGNLAEARVAYEAALESGAGRAPFVELKLEQLAQAS